MLEGHFLVIVIIAVALLFDFLNGVNDSANSIATVVSTRVLSPKFAVAWAAFFNFVAFLFFGVHVATTIGKGIVRPEVVTEYLLLAGLVGAIIWTYGASHYGMPISVSHALMGGFAGAAVAKAGFSALIFTGIRKVLIFIVLSPLIGFLLGFLSMVLIYWLFRRAAPYSIDRYFRILQLVSSAVFSIGHGTNDAQKTMGIIAILLFSAGYLGDTFYVPLWVVLAAHTAIALGTLVGGWKVIRTLGINVTKLRPVGGFCAESSAAVTLIGTALTGIPVSTTHTITGSILGVGSTVRLSAVRWGVARNIIWAWILTIPGSFSIAFGTYSLLDLFLV